MGPRSDEEALRDEIDAKLYKARCEALMKQLEVSKRQALADSRLIRKLYDERDALRRQLRQLRA